MTPYELEQAQKHARKDTFMWGLKAFLVLFCLWGIQVLIDYPLLNFILENPPAYSLIIWMVYCFFEGKLHAHYYVHEINSQYKEDFNEHGLFSIMRFCVLIPLLSLIGWKIVLCYAIMQPFLHNGSYYHHRNKLDKSYPKGWFDHSKTSTALSTILLTPVVRTVSFIIGIIGLIYFSI